MSFNHSKFNRAGFNVQAEKRIFSPIKGSEAFTASVGAGLNFYSLAILNERITKEIEGFPVNYNSFHGNETFVKDNIEGQAVVYRKLNFSETIESEAGIAATVMPALPMSEKIEKDIAYNAELYVPLSPKEDIAAETSAGAIFNSGEIIGYEHITESASLENIVIKVCMLEVALRPGQVLIIDAGTYNILLDSENAIDIHSGDWIDELDRETTEIKIDAAFGASNLSATILYTERYL